MNYEQDKGGHGSVVGDVIHYCIVCEYFSLCSLVWCMLVYGYWRSGWPLQWRERVVKCQALLVIVAFIFEHVEYFPRCHACVLWWVMSSLTCWYHMTELYYTSASVCVHNLDALLLIYRYTVCAHKYTVHIQSWHTLHNAHV